MDTTSFQTCFQSRVSELCAVNQDHHEQVATQGEFHHLWFQPQHWKTEGEEVLGFDSGVEVVVLGV